MFSLSACLKTLTLLIMKKTILFICFLSNYICHAQDFINNDLTGTVGISSLPLNWLVVPETDPNSLSTSALQSTPDLSNTTGPNQPSGINGNPYSGNTMLTGLNGMNASSGWYWHEGIMQTVSGFSPGCTYDVNFFQTVVKQSNALDQSGSWAVYLDNTLIGITAVSNSNLPFNSNSLAWDFRTLTFTATNASHTIKFLPEDNDNSHELSSTDPNGGLRMGIDSIYITSGLTNPTLTHLGNDTSICENTSIILDATTNGATYSWNDNSTSATLSVNSAGIYWVDITNGCNNTTHRDSITIGINYLPIVDLGNDVEVCENTPVFLDATFPGATYSWNGGSTNSTNTVNQQGIHSVLVTNSCGSATDSVEVIYISCNEPEEKCYVFVPNTFTPDHDGKNDKFGVSTECVFEEFTFTIFNAWGEVIFKSENPLELWSGKYDNMIVKSGTYIWKLDYSLPNNTDVFEQIGHVNVLR